VAASVVPAPAAQAVAPYARMGMTPRPAPRFADGNGVMPNGLRPNGLRASQPPSLPADLGFIPPQRAPQPAGNGGAALVIDLTAGNGAAASEGATANATSPEDAVRATLIRNRASVIPQGAILAAVLNSDRPGLARAVVTADVRGFDGTRLLIPRGSRLIGEFKAENTPGLRRVLVLWTRLIRPDGVAIRIGSPVTDAMGGAGVAGSVNTHFAEKLASAVLQSALTIGTNVASTLPQSGNSAIYLGLPGQASQLGQQLVPSANRAATVKVREGTQIAVLVARDLDFSGTPVVR
jgi:type IV secretion system protein VirB10